MPKVPEGWRVIGGGGEPANPKTLAETPFTYKPEDTFPPIFYPTPEESQELVNFVRNKLDVPELDEAERNAALEALGNLSLAELHARLRELCFSVRPEQRDMGAIRDTVAAMEAMLRKT